MWNITSDDKQLDQGFGDVLHSGYDWLPTRDQVLQVLMWSSITSINVIKYYKY